MSEENMMAPQGSDGLLENAPTRPEVSLTQQFAGFPMEHRPDEKITADEVKALSYLVNPLDELENLELQQEIHESNHKKKPSPVLSIIGAGLTLSGVLGWVGLMAMGQIQEMRAV